MSRSNEELEKGVQSFREAVTKNEVDRVRQILLARRTIPIDDPVLGNEPALHLAIKRGWVALVMLLLEFKVRLIWISRRSHQARRMSMR